MKKLLGITVAAVLLGMPVLAGCGGGADDVSSDGKTTSSDPTETTESTESTEPTESSEPTEDTNADSDYCDALKGAKDNLSAIDFSQINEKVYSQLTGELVKVARVAPSDVKDDWARLLGVLTVMHRLLASAGIDFDDLADLSAGTLPPGVDAEQLQKIAPKITKISADGKLQQAATNIQKSAQQECGLTLN
jgi:hypothetical protein